ncbi:hypothetical protein AGLY_011386 [Aphis glycines]|uniref:Uncharacterized protein n=1 Tax=Aphis glycines TaxID=307491 RepID=A0A6G0TEM5_APHGL|nr:hypothetical protein AGLY_011386 [Aphis glycines]
MTASENINLPLNHFSEVLLVLDSGLDNLLELLSENNGDGSLFANYIIIIYIYFVLKRFLGTTIIEVESSSLVCAVQLLWHYFLFHGEIELVMNLFQELDYFLLLCYFSYPYGVYNYDFLFWRSFTSICSLITGNCSTTIGVSITFESFESSSLRLKRFIFSSVSILLFLVTSPKVRCRNSDASVLGFLGSSLKALRFFQKPLFWIIIFCFTNCIFRFVLHI